MATSSATNRRKRGRPAVTDGSAPTSRAAGRPGSEDGSVGPESLMDMTLALLSERAPSEITRASLARHANVDPGLIRYYFKNRDSLMRSAAQTLTRRLQSRGAAASELSDLTPAERICARTRALLAFKIDNPFYHRLMMEEMARSEDDESKALFHEIAAAAIARYRGYLAAGEADGTLRNVDPGYLYMAIIGLCDFFVIASPVLQPQLDKKTPEATRSEYADFICDLLLNGLRPR